MCEWRRARQLKDEAVRSVLCSEGARKGSTATEVEPASREQNARKEKSKTASKSDKHEKGSIRAASELEKQNKTCIPARRDIAGGGHRGSKR